MAQVWYDQTTTVDGVKGNDNRGSTTVEHWYKAMVGDYSDRLRRRTDGRGMISGHMYRRGGHETGESMTGHSTRCGITMQQSPGISQGNVHSAWRQQQQQQLSHHPIPSHPIEPSHRKPDRCCIASRTRKVSTRPSAPGQSQSRPCPSP
jgi:hypothetical protein